MFEWLRRLTSRRPSPGTAREPVPEVDPMEELLRIVGEVQDRDAEDERRLGDPKWRNRPQTYPRRGARSR